MNQAAPFELARRLCREGAALGDVFAFISGLYFRGKIAYSTAFGTPLVITAGRGLLPPETLITVDDLRAIAAVPVDLADPLYRKPLERDALQLHRSLDPDCEVVLLGSLATPKYLEPLIDILGSRLLVPSEFVGLGDMSRGGLMLRCVREGKELSYIRASYEPKKSKKRGSETIEPS
jgi:hypothetical protein